MEPHSQSGLYVLIYKDIIMSKISELIEAGIPVIEVESNELLGSYAFSSPLTLEQRIIFENITNPKPAKEEEIFNLPIRAPSITVSNVFIESPKPKTDPNEALAEALAEAAKTRKKDMSLIVVSMLHYIDKKVKK